MQITTGIRSILSIAFFYETYQKIVFPRDKVIADYIKPFAGQKVLDIGCGTGNLCEYLKMTDYLGIDTSLDYIKTAKKRYGKHARFQHVGISHFNPEHENYFDVAISIGVLHHISDAEILTLFTLAEKALRPGGKFIAVEPCYTPEQSKMAKWIISKDRGLNIKNVAGYEALTKKMFPAANFDVRHDLLRIPFTMLVIENIKS